MRDHVAVGDRMWIEAGYGRFDYQRGEQSQVWLAGGIGITPFLTFADSLTADNNRDITLIYCISKKDEAVGLARLKAAAALSGRFKFHLHISETDGRMDATKLRAFLPFDITKSGLWFCGPAPMRKSILSDLSTQRQSPRSVHFEEFEFR